jgi:hypothetical protein
VRPPTAGTGSRPDQRVWRWSDGRIGLGPARYSVRRADFSFPAPRAASGIPVTSRSCRPFSGRLRRQQSGLTSIDDAHEEAIHRLQDQLELLPSFEILAASLLRVTAPEPGQWKTASRHVTSRSSVSTVSAESGLFASYCCRGMLDLPRPMVMVAGGQRWTLSLLFCTAMARHHRKRNGRRPLQGRMPPLHLRAAEYQQTCHIC